MSSCSISPARWMYLRGRTPDRQPRGVPVRNRGAGHGAVAGVERGSRPARCNDRHASAEIDTLLIAGTPGMADHEGHPRSGNGCDGRRRGSGGSARSAAAHSCWRMPGCWTASASPRTGTPAIGSRTVSLRAGRGGLDLHQGRLDLHLGRRDRGDGSGAGAGRGGFRTQHRAKGCTRACHVPERPGGQSQFSAPLRRRSPSVRRSAKRRTGCWPISRGRCRSNRWRRARA